VNVTRKGACLAAAAAGLIGAGLIAVTLSPGDGENYVTILVRCALTLLVFSVAAVALAVHAPKGRLVWALAAVAHAMALAVAFGMVKSSVASLRPVEVLGAPILGAAAAQLAAFIVAVASRE
jgi:hypothetical protein